AVSGKREGPADKPRTGDGDVVPPGEAPLKEFCPPGQNREQLRERGVLPLGAEAHLDDARKVPEHRRQARPRLRGRVAHLSGPPGRLLQVSPVSGALEAEGEEGGEVDEVRERRRARRRGRLDRSPAVLDGAVEVVRRYPAIPARAKADGHGAEDVSIVGGRGHRLF